MNKRITTLLIAMIFGYQGLSLAADTQVDSLIRKLVDKGILTDKEATGLKGEIAYDEKSLRETNMKKDIPEWVQNTKVTGDFRARLQTSHRQGAGTVENTQGRMRARLNLEMKPNDKAKVVIGIATNGGANNARSNNVTFSGDTSTEAANKPFAKTNVVLNKAYGQYKFNDNWSGTLGKMDNPIWEPMEFLWDSDITPEGGSLRFDHKVSNTIDVFATGNFFMLNNFSGSTSDPSVWVAQIGGTVKPTEKADIKIVGSYHGYQNIKSGFTGSRSNNTAGLAANGATSLLYDYSAPMGAAEIGFNDVLPEAFPLYIPRMAVFGEFTKNPAAKTQDVAWMAGSYLGNSKVNGFGTWKLTGAYKVINRDAWLDILPDSDFYSGNTGVKGTEGILEVGLAKNMSFVLDYYETRKIKIGTGSKAKERLLQADLNWKF